MFSRGEHQAILAFGSNVGGREGHIAAALAALDALDGVRVLAVSPVYETRPVGLAGQPDFLNAVGAVATTLSPEVLLEACLRIELERGRVRLVQNGPRTLDIDLLFFDDERRQTPQLTLPHPRYAERAFVCVPLAALLASVPLAAEPRWDALRRELAALPEFDAGACRLWAKSL